MAAYVKGSASATDTSNTSVIAAVGAGIKVFITDVIISNSSSTDTEVEIKDGTTVVATYPAPQKAGAVHALRSPIECTANTAVQFASLASVTTMKVTILGVTGA